MTAVERRVIEKTSPVTRTGSLLNRMVTFVRDQFRGYTDQELRAMQAAALGNINPYHRSKYILAQPLRYYLGETGSCRLPASPGLLDIPPSMGIGQLLAEIRRLNGLDTGSLDREVQQDALQWFQIHGLPAPSPLSQPETDSTSTLRTD